MAFTKKLEFGNYTLKFGEDNVLLDLFHEVVMPSFHEMKYIRRLKDKGEYFFIDSKLVTLDNNPDVPVLGISGKIVKNTKLKRDQIYRADGGLIEDQSELETAPSSTFLLILNTHRLILCKEVAGAPSIQNFHSTSQYCLKQQHKIFLESEFEKAKQIKEENPDAERITKKALVGKYPYPVLRITPLSDKESLKNFVTRLKHIDKVSIKLLSTNKEEIDNDDFWSDFGRRREEMNSKSARVEFSNPKEGLEGDEVFEQARAASGLGNSEVRLKGYDKQGDTINGSNDDFSLTVELEELPRNAERAATVKYEQFRHLVDGNVIKLPDLADEVIAKIVSIFRGL
ncbi:hypothetical protein [Vibrio quintilis]|uniref:Uncharacterized protein n=1 Tax=Vibrio quintilis TaxID=1117707 RepID=A0A1M7YPT1_9VIBR|nr:hypothetical protein [Vibrio quintilis]SHO54653.1 hypothetical protein VQ7734_00367 [Vibrio quintilis]